MTFLEEREAVKAILGIKGDELDGAVDIAVGEAEEFICRYCNISEVPDELKRVEAAMAAEIYRERGIGKTEKSGGIKAVYEGDVSVTYNSVEGGGFLNDFGERLNAYRKAGW